MALEETLHLSTSKSPDDPSIRDSLPYSITGNIDADWYNLTENTVSKAKMEREELGKRIRQEIRDTVATIREKYAYQEYTIDDKPANFDSLEVLWDPTTQKISKSIIHLKQGDAKHEVHVTQDEKGHMSLWSHGKGGLHSVKEGTGKNKQKVISISSQVITNKDPVEELVSIPKTILPINEQIGAIGKSMVRRRVGNNKLIKPETKVGSSLRMEIPTENKESESDKILREHFPGIKKTITGLSIVSVNGSNVGSDGYRLDYKYQGGEISLFSNNGVYKLHSYGSRDVLVIVGGKEHFASLDVSKGEVLLELSQRQKFLDQFGTQIFEFHPNEQANLQWKGYDNPRTAKDKVRNIESFSLVQASAIITFHDKIQDGTTMKFLAQKVPYGDLMLIREGSTDSDYFAIIVTKDGIVKSTVKRSILTPLIGAKLNESEEKLIQKVKVTISPYL